MVFKKQNKKQKRNYSREHAIKDMPLSARWVIIIFGLFYS